MQQIVLTESGRRGLDLIEIKINSMGKRPDQLLKQRSATSFTAFHSCALILHGEKALGLTLRIPRQAVAALRSHRAAASSLMPCWAFFHAADGLEVPLCAAMRNTRQTTDKKIVYTDIQDAEQMKPRFIISSERVMVIEEILMQARACCDWLRDNASPLAAPLR